MVVYCFYYRESGLVMKENKYDDESFFAKYRQKPRSSDGLKSILLYFNGERKGFKKK